MQEQVTQQAVQQGPTFVTWVFSLGLVIINSLVSAGILALGVREAFKSGVRWAERREARRDADRDRRRDERRGDLRED
jgi:hypothetical protein